MQYDNITNPEQLQRLCQRLASAKTIGFDTEFVSEDSYRPDLCLLQVAADDVLAVVDTKAVEDLTCFWELLAEPGRQSVVHAAREEMLFCLRAIGRLPHDVMDVQLAAGLVGLEYPAAYGTLISRLLGKSLSKGETRTNWRKRPLSERQIKYALQDVLYLEPLRDTLTKRLNKLGRDEWLAGEMEVRKQEFIDFENEERWWRVSGLTGLSQRGLAVVRELWRWREGVAERRDSPVRRVLRDDLIVELARRESADPKRIGALRGMERRDLRKHIPDLEQAIQKALDLPQSELPRRAQRSSNNQPQLNLLGQFLATALGGICREAQIAPMLVGTVQDVRDYVAWRLGLDGAPQEPALAVGWRSQIVGRRIDDLLSGKTAIVIGDPLADQPLAFRDLDGSESAEPASTEEPE
ncbi:MAG: HRDC domain-containing protein [Pirellulaceae bacterium]